MSFGIDGEWGFAGFSDRTFGRESSITNHGYDVNLYLPDKGGKSAGTKKGPRLSGALII